MEQVIMFLSGTGMAISLAVFVFGMVARLVLYFLGLDWRLDRVAYKPYMGMAMKGGFWSIFKWLIPFGTYGWRAQPFFTTCFYLLHFGAVLVPLFLIGHNEMLQMQFGFSLPVIPQILADILTVATIIGISLITLRRIALSEVRILTSANDYFILALVAIPFITGFIARMSNGAADGWMLCHLISGELMLILAPFTKLSHIVLYFGSRWQLGADYSVKRGGHRRGAYFPW